MTTSVTFRISCSNDARTMIFFFVLQVFRVRDVKNLYLHTVTITRDFVRQGHVTTSVTYRISCSNDARTMIFFVLQVFRVRDVKNLYFHTVTITRDFVRQGHVTTSMTFRISCSNDARTMIFFCRFLGSGMSNIHSYLVRYIYLKNPYTHKNSSIWLLWNQ